MLKNFISLFIAILSSIFGIKNISNVNINKGVNPEPTQAIVTPVVTQTTTNDTVPPPTSEDIIRTFFNLITEQRISEAVMMMSTQNTTNDTTKQAWGVHFNNFASMKVQGIEKSMPEEWTADRQTYRVNVDVTLKAGSTPDQVLWENGVNTRWVSLVKENNLWKIDGLATGP